MELVYDKIVCIISGLELRSLSYMKNHNLGLSKKSFSMPYNGGEIWFEHLDGINDEAQLKQKFEQDLIQIIKPSTSSFIAINLDETIINQEMLECILEKLYSSDKLLRKVVFVGLNTRMKRYIKQQKNMNISMNCIDDFEQAKKWLIP